MQEETNNEQKENNETEEKSNLASWILTIISVGLTFTSGNVYAQPIGIELIVYALSLLILPVGISLCVGWVIYRLRKKRENSFFIYFAVTFLVLSAITFLSELELRYASLTS